MLNILVIEMDINNITFHSDSGFLSVSLRCLLYVWFDLVFESINVCMRYTFVIQGLSL